MFHPQEQVLLYSSCSLAVNVFLQWVEGKNGQLEAKMHLLSKFKAHVALFSVLC